MNTPYVVKSKIQENLLSSKTYKRSMLFSLIIFVFVCFSLLFYVVLYYQ